MKSNNYDIVSATQAEAEVVDNKLGESIMTQDPQSFIVCPNLIIMREHNILLLRRADWAPLFPGYWHVPTGKIETGESPKQAITREAFEEVGLKINSQGNCCSC